MHEMSIAEGVLSTSLAAAREHGAESVEEVHVELGVMRLVVPEALEMAWEVLTEGTPAAGSRLVTAEVPLAGRCRACHAEYAPTVDDFTCPACGEADVEILRGNDIIVTSVVCRTPDENGASAS